MTNLSYVTAGNSLQFINQSRLTAFYEILVILSCTHIIQNNQKTK